MIDGYRSSLDLTSDVARGQAAFVKHYAICHKAGEQGANVGPQFASVTNKSPEDLVVAIFDPNRETQAIYQSYTVITDAGRVLSGLLVSDSAAAVTLRQAEGKEESIPPRGDRDAQGERRLADAGGARKRP